MVQALELLYALGGKPVSRVFTYMIMGSWTSISILRAFKSGIGPPHVYNKLFGDIYCIEIEIR